MQARVIWVWAQAQPALFGLLGAAVDLAALSPSLLGRGLLVLGGGRTTPDLHLLPHHPAMCYGPHHTYSLLPCYVLRTVYY